MRAVLIATLATVIPSTVTAQTNDDVRSASEIPEDMPGAPESAPPAEAPAVDGTDERPPHPKTPDPLEEAQPSAETLAATMYHWLPGHWVWTGAQFEWRNGSWIYAVKDMVLVPPRWEWDGKQWVFHGAGWAKLGTREVIYSPTPAPGGSDVVQSADKAPGESSEPHTQREAQVTVYVWTGVYVAPLILYPRWHPHYHYHWYHRHPRYRRAPAYRSRRYHYARTHHHYHHHHRRPPSSRPASSRSPSRTPSTRPSEPPTTKPSSKPSQTPSTKPSSSSQRPASYPSGSRRRSGGRRGMRR